MVDGFVLATRSGRYGVFLLPAQGGRVCSVSQFREEGCVVSQLREEGVFCLPAQGGRVCSVSWFTVLQVVAGTPRPQELDAAAPIPSTREHR